MSAIDYVVESYHPGVYSGRPDEVVISGWLTSDMAVRAMTLEVDGDPPQSFPIDDHRLPSPDLEDIFGARGRDARFHAVITAARTSLSFDRARLVVEFDAGRVGIAIGDMYSRMLIADAASSDLVSRCESLGNNCEFGFMQRRLGVDQLGLFRFSGSFSGHEMARAIREGFEGFAENDDLQAGLHYGEWVVKSRRYGFTLHTGRFPHQISEDDIRRKEGTKLRYLVKKFYEDVADAEKLFVRRVREGDPTEAMIEVHRAMRAHGQTRLLWVNEADDIHPHGAIREVEDGLMHAYIGHLAPFEDAFDLRPELWIDLLRRVPHFA